MDNVKILASTAREFCIAWFSKRDLELASSYLSMDVQFVGTEEKENIQGRQEFTEYIRQDLAESKTPFEIEFYTEQEHYITADVGTSVLEFRMVNVDYEWRGNASVTLSKTGGGRDSSAEYIGNVSSGNCWEICQLHFSIPTPVQEHSGHYPPSLVKKHLKDMRHEFLASSIAGGLIGAYRETGYPSYNVKPKFIDFSGFSLINFLS